MTLRFQIAVGLWALGGHFALWISVFSRVHAIGLRRWQLEVVEKLLFLVLLGALAAVVHQAAVEPTFLVRPLDSLQQHGLVQVYFWTCFGVACQAVSVWTWRVWKGQPRQYLRGTTRVVDVVRELGTAPCGTWTTRLLARVPGNQFLEFEVNTKELWVPHLPPALDGLTIAHLSDLHFTGRITRAFFDVVVARTNAMQADLIAITGDILDEECCLSWIGEVLGQLRSRDGVYCIFGNHDLRLGDVPRQIAEVERAGVTYLGGRWRKIQVRGQSLLVAGNERPWLKWLPDLATVPASEAADRPLRLLLSHSPDQIAWARAAGFDLMLAGHTHGGQIRLPLLGPIVGQSVYGLKFCSGVFYVRPTLLHVSRGVSQLQNLRLHCRPEIVKLVLRRTAG